jgi:PAS domain S-box-containing protein
MDEATVSILLVEDEAAHANLIKRAFGRRENRERLIVAASLEEARAHLSQELPPDLVIADLLLPDGRGTELLPSEGEEYPYPVMIMTSHGDEKVAVEAIKGGAVDYVVKSAHVLADLPHIAERAMREWGHIVDRRRAEKALQRSERRFRRLFEHSNDAIFIYTFDGSIVDVNHRACEMLGLRTDELVRRSILTLHPDGESYAAGDALQTTLERGAVRFESRFQKTDGETIYVDVSARIVDREQGLVQGIARDITETKRRTAELSALVELSEAISSTLDLEEVLTLVTERMAVILGVDGCTISQWDRESDAVVTWVEYQTGAASAEPFGTRYDLDDFPATRAVLESCRPMMVHVSDEDADPHEVAYMQRTGTVSLLMLPLVIRDQVVGLFELDTTGRRRDFSAADIRLAQALADQAAVAIENARLFDQAQQEITEREQAERALRESEERYRALFEQANDAIFVENQDGEILDVNHRACELLGYTREELLAMKVTDLQAPEVRGEAGSVTRAELEHHADRPFESIDIHRDGTRIPVEISKSPLMGQEDGLVLSIVRDITERKQAEEARRKALAEALRATHALRESEARLRSVLDHAPVVIWALDRDGVFTFSEGRGLDSLRLEPGEVVGRSVFEVYAGFPETISDARRALAGDTFSSSTQIGDVAFESRYVPLKDEHGNVIGTIGVALDVTERRRVEEQIHVSLREKETLLQEIHHRVKNNLQVISSLLRLQSARVDDPHTLSVLTESRGRVRSMALVHEMLYQSENLARVDFGAYVRNLTGYLIRAYRTSSTRVALRSDVQDVTLGIDLAVPCGLVINELVSNALKHGFPGDREGEITIKMRADPDTITLVVSDDGVGLPNGLEWQRADSLGLQLVVMLVEQLEGVIELDSSAGTVFRITFPRPAHQEGA